MDPLSYRNHCIQFSPSPSYKPTRTIPWRRIIIETETLPSMMSRLGGRMHIDRPHPYPLPGEKVTAPIPRFWVSKFRFSQHYKHGPLSSMVGVISHDSVPLRLSLSFELVFSRSHKRDMRAIITRSIFFPSAKLLNSVDRMIFNFESTLLYTFLVFPPPS